MTQDVMLDLETLSTASDAAVVSIGAVHFMASEGQFFNRNFHANVEMDDAVRSGGRVDGSTVEFWLKQSEAARASLFAPKPVRLAEALDAFTFWLTACGPVSAVWGNGADFDNVVLRSAYVRLGLKCPWTYRQNRCYRTVKELFGRPSHNAPDSGVAHCSVDDAQWQARTLCNILKSVRDRV